MKKINSIWEELETDNSLSQGLLFRRYSTDVLPDVYISLKVPEKQRSIAAFIDTSLKADISSFSKLKDIKVDLIQDEHYGKKTILLFSLLTKRYEDIFSVLCEDLISNISSFTSDAELVKEILNRFEKWKSLFEQASMPGLTPEMQRGLFGELIFLKTLLQKTSDFNSVITSWVGPEKEIRDFQLRNWSVEVKTTIGNNHQKIHISNERQLDTSTIRYLFLYHISLEQQQNNGITLNQVVDEICDILSSDSLSQNRFFSKLFSYGYFDAQRDLYEQTGYHLRNDCFFKVDNDFPRVEEKDLRKGVGDLKYSIIVSQLDSYKSDENEVLQKFSGI